MEPYEKLYDFVLARRVETGGFGAAPTLAASVQDTFYALGILHTLYLMSPGKEILILKDKGLIEYIKNFTHYQFTDLLHDPDHVPKKYHDSSLDAHHAENRISTLRNWFQNLYSRRILCMEIKKEWLPPALEKVYLKDIEDTYYWLRILGEIYGISLTRGKENFWHIMSNRWETADELYKIIYICEKVHPETFHAKRKEWASWLRACQSPDGGFGGRPGTTSFVDKTYACLKGLSILKEKPSNPHGAAAFVISCKTADGGFARKSGGAPFLDSTWYAVASLEYLKSMDGF